MVYKYYTYPVCCLDCHKSGRWFNEANDTYIFTFLFTRWDKCLFQYWFGKQILFLCAVCCHVCNIIFFMRSLYKWIMDLYPLIRLRSSLEYYRLSILFWEWSWHMYWSRKKNIAWKSTKAVPGCLYCLFFVRLYNKE